jgi:hypothetical protein
MAKRLDDNGTLYLLSKLLLLFQRQESGKGLSTNDLTDSLKAAILAQFSGSYSDLTNKPTNVSEWVNDAQYQSLQQVEAAIDEAVSQIDTTLYIAVDALPDVADANPNKIYVIVGDSTEWFIKSGAWEQVGEAAPSLEGYFNETNLVPITNTEIDSMIASLTA